jgi:hypothetical protein
MMRLLRLWLPVVPFAMAVLVLLYAAPDLGRCSARGPLLSLWIGCEPVDLPAVVVGPVDLVRGAPVPDGDPMTVALFAALAVVVAAVGANRLRGAER